MATKAYASGNYFYLEVEGTTEPLMDSKSAVRVWKSNDVTDLYVIKSPEIGRHEVLLSDLTDDLDVAYTLATWKTFYEGSTGFNSATGGSVAKSFEDTNANAGGIGAIITPATETPFPIDYTTPTVPYDFIKDKGATFEITYIWDLFTGEANTLMYMKGNINGNVFKINVLNPITGLKCVSKIKGVCLGGDQVQISVFTDVFSPNTTALTDITQGVYEFQFSTTVDTDLVCTLTHGYTQSTVSGMTLYSSTVKAYNPSKTT